MVLFLSFSMLRRQGQSSGRCTLIACVLVTMVPFARSGDEKALIALYSDTYGSRWTRATGWGAGSVCDWFGVRCAQSTQNVE